MISSFLVEELAQLAERSSQMTLAYYFCDDKDERRRTATAILRGLLLQLLRQRPVLFKHIQPDFDVTRDRLFTDFYALQRIFDNIVKDPEAGEVYCLIDALDECEKESRQLFLTNFTKIFSSQQSKKRVVKFIVTSRGENDIKESLVTAGPVVQNLQIDSGRVNDDLSKFINVKVDELSKKKRYQPKQKDMIKHALTEKAGGTFLYISLVVQDLAKTKIFSLVSKKLQELPSDLNKVYDRILNQIDAECEEIAKSVLRWVAVARRPLTVDELAMARALGQGEWEKNTVPPEDLLDELKDGFKCCEPLVYIDTDKDTVNLVHQSAKDYLLGTYLQGKDGVSQYHIVTDCTNLLIFRTCWTYLSLEEFKQGTVIIERDADHRLRQTSLNKHLLYDHCFLRYADQEWQEHALAASRALATGYEFRKDNLDRLPTLRDTWLLRAAAEGQEVVVQRLLENGAELKSKDNYSRTPLLWAAEKGHEKVVQMLLDKGADVNAQGGTYGNALQAASAGGHVAVVRLLLDRGADVNAGLGHFGSALQAASAGDHQIVIRLLIDRGALINSVTKYGPSGADDDDAASSSSSARSTGSLISGSANSSLLFSARSASSATSIGNEAPEEVFTFLVAEVFLNLELKDLFKRLLEIRGEPFFIRVFKREVREFCSALRAESPSDLQKGAIRILRRHREYFAYRVCRLLEPSTAQDSRKFEELMQQIPAAEAGVEEYLQHLPRVIQPQQDAATVGSTQDTSIGETFQSGSRDAGDYIGDHTRDKSRQNILRGSEIMDDEINASDSSDGADRLPQSLTQEIISWLVESSSFRNLKDYITRSICAPLQHVQEVIQPDPSASKMYSMTLHIDWELIRYAKTELEEGQQLSTVLVVSGGIIDAEASPCLEYCRRVWPLTGEFVVKTVEKAIKYGSHGKRTVRSLVIAS